jgi:hypothetical protein
MEQDAGLPNIKKQLSELNAQILTKVAEANKSTKSFEAMIANLENPNNRQQLGIPMAAIIGQQAQARKMQLAEANNYSADIMLLQAVASGVQGNINAMQDNINRAIDLKYKDREDTLNVKMQQLAILKDKMDREDMIFSKAEQRQMLDLERKYQEEQRKIQEQKEKSKENVKLAFSANVKTQLMNRNGEWSDARTGYTFETPEELFKATGLKSFDEAYRKGMVTDVTPERVADIEYVSQLRAKYGDAGITINDTPASATAKIKNSAIYGKETYIDPYDSLYRKLSIEKMQSEIDAGKAGAINSSSIDSRVKQIIKANPGEYGNAANQIDAEFGTGTASMYDSWLRRVYNYNQNIDDVTSGKTPTEGQYLSAAFANRLENSGKEIERLQDSIKGMGYLEFKKQEALPSKFQSDTFRQYHQAVTDFITAKLRKESGAQIAANEFADAYKVYIPQPGDDSKTLEQKAKARQQASKDMASSAGNAYQLPSSSQGMNNGSVQMKSPDGQAFEVPVDKVELFKQNGYTQMSFNSVGKTSASIIASAIKKVESDGNYSAKGGSGEYGAYQFMPSTWKDWAGKYLGNANAPLTPQNQDKVALARINDLLKMGYSPEQVALTWNHGSPKRVSGVNKYGVKYDSGAYADKVMAALKQLTRKTS